MQDKSNLLELLRDTPLVQPACQRAGVSRATYYRWRKEDADFKKESDEAINQGRLLINDLAESKLISQIRNENMTAIIYWLKNNHKNYVENKVYLNESDIKAMVKDFELRDIRKLYARIIEMFASGEINRTNVNSMVSILKGNDRYKDIEIDKQAILKKELKDLSNLIEEVRGMEENEDKTRQLKLFKDIPESNPKSSGNFLQNVE